MWIVPHPFLLSPTLNNKLFNAREDKFYESESYIQEQHNPAEVLRS